MKNLIKNFPQDISTALEIAESYNLRCLYPKISNILICGLGGSGIGGKLVSSWFYDELDVPVNFCQGYEIPNFVNVETLVIATSYSGDTEETLSAIEQAHQKGASIIGLTSGGNLKDFCIKHGYDYLVMQAGNPPRTQLGFSFVLLTSVLLKLRLIQSNPFEQFRTAIAQIGIKEQLIQQKAKEIADLISNRELILYTDDRNEPIAIRARQQFNENSKILCSHHVIPEMNHNELVGWAGARSNITVLFIESGEIHLQNTKRVEFSKEIIKKKAGNVFNLKVNYGHRIVDSLVLIHIIDWASYYLALDRKVDPVEVNVIGSLKQLLVQ